MSTAQDFLTQFALGTRECPAGDKCDLRRLNSYHLVYGMCANKEPKKERHESIEEMTKCLVQAMRVYYSNWLDSIDVRNALSKIMGSNAPHDFHSAMHENYRSLEDWSRAFRMLVSEHNLLLCQSQWEFESWLNAHFKEIAPKVLDRFYPGRP
jgi:hypothetical protein